MSVAQTKSLVREYLLAGVTPIIMGGPGTGKSEGVQQLAAEDDAILYETRLGLYESVDIHGMPHILNGAVVWAVPDCIAAVNAFPRDRKVYWFLDEYNIATPAVMAASMQLTLNRRINSHVLNDNVQIICAGNRQSDRASANRIPTAAARRLGRIDHEPDLEEVRTHLHAKGSPREVTGFLKFRPNMLFALPANEDDHFPNPAGWEMVGRRAIEIPETLRPLWVRGIVGPGAASEFETWFRIGVRATRLEAILADPVHHPVPGDDEPALQVAVASMLSLGATRQNLDAIATYADRMPKDLNVMTMVDATNRDKTLLKTNAFTSWAGRNQDVKAA